LPCRIVDCAPIVGSQRVQQVTVDQADNVMTNNLRDELELRRRHALNEIDELMDYWLYRELNPPEAAELVDCIEHVLADADQVVLRKLSPRK
jgi:hypothetical protein